MSPKIPQKNPGKACPRIFARRSPQPLAATASSLCWPDAGGMLAAACIDDLFAMDALPANGSSMGIHARPWEDWQRPLLWTRQFAAAES
jgi:hypothetical protein